MDLPDSEVAIPECCQNCGDPLDDSGALWDGQWSCRDCIAPLVHAEFGSSPPEETVQIGLRDALWRGLLSALFTNMVVAGLVFVLFFLIQLSLQLENLGAGKPFNAAKPEIWLMFLGGVFGMATIVSFPIYLFSLTKRHRTICIDEKHLIHRTAFQSLRIPLDDCVWYESQIGGDGRRFLYWNRPLIRVYNRRNSQEAIVCGFSAGSRRHWAGYFTLTLRYRYPGIRHGRPVLTCLFGLLVGGTVGVIVGSIVNLIMRDPRWITSCSLIGFVDGIAWGYLNALIKAGRIQRIKLPFELGKYSTAAMFMLPAGLLGAKLRPHGGINALVACGIANCVLGGIWWWSVRSNGIDP